MLKLLRLLNAPSDLDGLIREAANMFHEWSGCEAVGIRLRDGEDYPYFETRGFPTEFVEAENRLCARDLDGQLLRDEQGNPVMECMCGKVLCGRIDRRQPFFTAHGSFWTNSASALLASTREEGCHCRTLSRCNREGYESGALIPLRAGGLTLGLLQCNDSPARAIHCRPDRSAGTRRRQPGDRSRTTQDSGGAAGEPGAVPPGGGPHLRLGVLDSAGLGAAVPLAILRADHRL